MPRDVLAPALGDELDDKGKHERCRQVDNEDSALAQRAVAVVLHLILAAISLPWSLPQLQSRDSASGVLHRGPLVGTIMSWLFAISNRTQVSGTGRVAFWYWYESFPSLRHDSISINSSSAVVRPWDRVVSLYQARAAWDEVIKLALGF